MTTHATLTTPNEMQSKSFGDNIKIKTKVNAPNLFLLIVLMS